MVRLKCPNCSNVIDAPAGTSPTCPACGFQGAVAAPQPANRAPPTGSFTAHAGTPFSPVENAPLQRPGWVTMVAVFQFIGGGFAILAGLLLATLGSAFARFFDELGDVVGGLIAVVGVVVIAFGVLSILLGTQVLKGREWARIVSLVLAFISGTFNLLGILAGNFPGVLSLAFDVLIIVGLLMPETKAWFAQQDARPPRASMPA